MSRTWKIVVLILCLATVAYFAIAFIAASRKKTARIPVCHSNLMNLELIKMDWAGENNKTTNDTPTWDDLRSYFPESWSNNIPVCPAGGTYILGRVGELPRCSIGGGYDHELLQ